MHANGISQPRAFLFVRGLPSHQPHLGYLHKAAVPRLGWARLPLQYECSSCRRLRWNLILRGLHLGVLLPHGMHFEFAVRHQARGAWGGIARLGEPNLVSCRGVQSRVAELQRVPVQRLRVPIPRRAPWGVSSATETRAYSVEECRVLVEALAQFQ